MRNSHFYGYNCLDMPNYHAYIDSDDYRWHFQATISNREVPDCWWVEIKDDEDEIHGEIIPCEVIEAFHEIIKEDRKKIDGDLISIKFNEIFDHFISFPPITT